MNMFFFLNAYHIKGCIVASINSPHGTETGLTLETSAQKIFTEANLHSQFS